MKILLLYNASQTFTNTVYEHVSAFAKYSQHHFAFTHVDLFTKLGYDLSIFDAIILHYSVRLPFDGLSETIAEQMKNYLGLKALFIQDEYDNTNRAVYWINRCCFDLVFTVVPEAHINRVYTSSNANGIKFVSTLTGFVPEDIPNHLDLRPPSERSLIIGYRTRELPIRYGQLGFEKVQIGKDVKSYCENNGVASDIAWTEESRIYGADWYEFVAKCRASLGTESGSNVFDWDGNLGSEIDNFRKNNPNATERESYDAVVRPREIPGLMNQLSPRIFEAIELRSVLVLYDGIYSGVVKPGRHFLALAKDLSNISEIFARLRDGRFCDEITSRAYEDIIGSGKYTYRAFIEGVDRALLSAAEEKGLKIERNPGVHREEVVRNLLRVAKGAHDSPKRAGRPDNLARTLADVFENATSVKQLGRRLAFYSWHKLPDRTRGVLKPKLRKLFRI